MYYDNVFIPKTHACFSSFNLAALLAYDLTKIPACADRIGSHL
jgi:hypothetical protein